MDLGRSEVRQPRGPLTNHQCLLSCPGAFFVGWPVGVFVESGFGSSGAGFGIGEANRQVVDHPNIVTQLPAIGCSTAGPVAANLQDLVLGDSPPLHTIFS